MSSKIFLQALQSKLKSGNSRSIYLNALPGRLVTRMDLKQLDFIEENLASEFLTTILTKRAFEFKISFDNIDLNQANQDTQKRLGLISKRLNSIIIENDEYFKDHGTKTLGFGYPLIIKRSSKDPSKIIKAPLFIWPIDAAKSKNKVNEWSLFRNKITQPNGSIVDADIHSISINEVFFSFVRGEDDIILPNSISETSEEAVTNSAEILNACAEILNALNSGSATDYLSILKENFSSPVNILPDSTEIDSIANNKAYIYFGGVFGLFWAQKESIITDIARLLERFDEFKFEELSVENFSDAPFSAVSTDPAQQAILNMLGREANQIIQGPPGTGKSQSLTALVTNALANGLKCLVVCEKKTALDVIRRNIEKTNQQMAALVAVIDDVNEDREAIVDSIRDRQHVLPNHQNVNRIKSRYTDANEKLTETAMSINTQHEALSLNIYNGMTWDYIVGRYLKLKKHFPQVPLKNVLNVKDFSLRKNESELKFILHYLGKADTLYHQSLFWHRSFDLLSDELFKEKTTGEARVKLETFITNARDQTPVLKLSISKLLSETAEWIDTNLTPVPNSIKLEINPFLPFLGGQNLSVKVLPEHFQLEMTIEELVFKLSQLREDLKQVREEYQSELTKHYKIYHDNLKFEISNYLKFVNDHVTTYGQHFLNNNKVSRLKTKLLSPFSDKYRRIKFGRLEVKSKINGVRIAQLQKTYISHHYNDDVIEDNLSIYVNNIIELQKKAEEWALAIPNNVNSYVTKLSDSYCHPDFDSIKERVSIMMLQYDHIVVQLNNRHGLLDYEEVAEINALIDCIPRFQETLAKHQHTFHSVRTQYRQRINDYNEIHKVFLNIEAPDNLKICKELYKPYQDLEEAIKRCDDILTIIGEIDGHSTGFRVYHDWRTYYLSLHPLSQKLINIVSVNIEKSWENAFECWYLFWILSLYEPPNLPKGDFELQQFKRLKSEFDKAQLDNVVAQWIEKQADSVREFKARGQLINSLFNKKGLKGTRRNSLRSIIKSEFQLFTDFFPVVLLNPSVCSSVIPLEEGIFDLVIFDEASQLRLEDTYPSLIRGKAKIVSGDKHQMAPSSYFDGGGGLLLDPDDDEGEDNEEETYTETMLQKTHLNLADSESLLAFAVDKGFKESYLTVHYRSRHPFLIDFSNFAFYGKRLIPVPATKDYIPIEFLQVDGLYDNHTNKSEAQQVVSILRTKIKSFENDLLPSVGVATFNMYQRNLIVEEIAAARQASSDFDLLMGKLGDSFFVKNLENIQGDERDIIIISSTFGPKSNGAFSQAFGPIIQSKGHRMLNVIITRAKNKIYICNSFPQEYLSQYAQLTQEKGNKGRAVLYSYLNYAKAVSDGNSELRESILDLVGKYCVDQHYDKNEPGIGSESVFEDEVYSRLAHHIGKERIEQQYKVGGFRIDMVVHPESSGGQIIAIECDGAKFHSSPEAYAWDIFRQEQLEKFGFIFYRIWSTNWWDSADKELENLLDFINEH